MLCSMHVHVQELQAKLAAANEDLANKVCKCDSDESCINWIQHKPHNFFFKHLPLSLG